MRIALVSTYPPSRGSLNEYAFYFVSHLRQKQEVQELLLLVDELPDGQSYPPDETVGTTSVRFIPSWRFGAPSNAWRLRRTIAELKPDVVLFNLQFATFGDQRIPAALGLLAPSMVKRAGFPTVILLHNIMETVDLRRTGFGSNPLMEILMRQFGQFFTRRLLQVDLVAVTIPKYVDILTQKYHADNIFLAPHGTFEEVPPPSFDLPAGHKQIMTFGKFGTYKKIEVLIEAFHLLQQEGISYIELVIAGTDSPNAAGYLKDVQARYSHVPNIRFTGYVAEEDVPTIFNAAAVVVFPYNSTTGSSGVLHQAGNYGKAVVLPHLGDFAELITEEGYRGEFFASDDPASLAQAIRHLLEDEPFRREMGQHNYLAAVGLPMTEIVDWYLLHFQNLMKK